MRQLATEFPKSYHLSLLRRVESQRQHSQPPPPPPTLAMLQRGQYGTQILDNMQRMGMASCWTRRRPAKTPCFCRREWFRGDLYHVNCSRCCCIATVCPINPRLSPRRRVMENMSHELELPPSCSLLIEQTQRLTLTRQWWQSPEDKYQQTTKADKSFKYGFCSRDLKLKDVALLKVAKISQCDNTSGTSPTNAPSSTLQLKTCPFAWKTYCLKSSHLQAVVRWQRCYILERQTWNRNSQQF